MISSRLGQASRINDSQNESAAAGKKADHQSEGQGQTCTAKPISPISIKLTKYNGFLQNLLLDGSLFSHRLESEYYTYQYSSSVQRKVAGRGGEPLFHRNRRASDIYEFAAFALYQVGSKLSRLNDTARQVDLAKKLSRIQSNIGNRLLRCKIIFNVANSLFACGSYANSEELCKFGLALCDQRDSEKSEESTEMLRLSIRFFYIRAVSAIVENSDLLSIANPEVASNKAEQLLRAETLLKRSLALLEDKFPEDIDQKYKLFNMLQKASNLLGEYSSNTAKLSKSKKKTFSIKKGKDLSDGRIERASQLRIEESSFNSSQNISKISNSSKCMHRISHHGTNSDRHCRPSKILIPKQIAKSSSFKPCVEIHERVAIVSQEAMTPRIGSKHTKQLDADLPDISDMIEDRQDNPDREVPAPDTLDNINNQLSPRKNKPAGITFDKITPAIKPKDVSIGQIGHIEDSGFYNPADFKPSRFNMLSRDNLTISIGDQNQTLVKSGPMKTSSENLSGKVTLRELGSLTENKATLSDMKSIKRQQSKSNMSEDHSAYNKEVTMPSSTIDVRKTDDGQVAKHQYAKECLRSYTPKLSVNTDSAITGQPDMSLNISRKNSQITTKNKAVGSARDMEISPRSSIIVKPPEATVYPEIDNINELTIRHYRSPQVPCSDPRNQLK